MTISRVAIAVMVALSAGSAGAVVVENPSLAPVWTPPAPTAQAGTDPASDLILWRNLSTAFNEAEAILGPKPKAPTEAAADDLLDVDLFRTTPLQPALP